jgi:hypothetical protein
VPTAASLVIESELRTLRFFRLAAARLASVLKSAAPRVAATISNAGGATRPAKVAPAATSKAAVPAATSKATVPAATSKATVPAATSKATAPATPVLVISSEEDDPVGLDEGDLPLVAELVEVFLQIRHPSYVTY